MSINTWRRTIAFSAGFVFITMPTGWLKNQPLIYFHSFFLLDPVSLSLFILFRFSYYYFLSQTRVHVRVFTYGPCADERLSSRKKRMIYIYTYCRLPTPVPNNSIVILRPNDFFINVSSYTTKNNNRIELLLKLTNQ